ncbi:hypothetical protein GCM10009789_20530 [Kribbella sancticallisti]|uniref:Uncharacterized protein n=1 Tax=Kribbella sancticallisti TaxID=460087 RepID=A0ABN2CYR4_9ACTN
MKFDARVALHDPSGLTLRLAGSAGKGYLRKAAEARVVLRARTNTASDRIIVALSNDPAARSVERPV